MVQESNAEEKGKLKYIEKTTFVSIKIWPSLIVIHYFFQFILFWQVAQIKEEIKTEYTLAMKRAIVDYILLDKEERRRVNIRNVPKQSYTPSIIRYVGCNTVMCYLDMSY